MIVCLSAGPPSRVFSLSKLLGFYHHIFCFLQFQSQCFLVEKFVYEKHHVHAYVQILRCFEVNNIIETSIYTEKAVVYSSFLSFLNCFFAGRVLLLSSPHKILKRNLLYLHLPCQSFEIFLNINMFSRYPLQRSGMLICQCIPDLHKRRLKKN